MLNWFLLVSESIFSGLYGQLLYNEKIEEERFFLHAFFLTVLNFQCNKLVFLKNLSSSSLHVQTKTLLHAVYLTLFVLSCNIVDPTRRIRLFYDTVPLCAAFLGSIDGKKNIVWFYDFILQSISYKLYQSNCRNHPSNTAVAKPSVWWDQFLHLKNTWVYHHSFKCFLYWNNRMQICCFKWKFSV